MFTHAYAKRYSRTYSPTTHHIHITHARARDKSRPVCETKKKQSEIKRLRLTALDVGNQQQQQQEENVSARVTDHRNTISLAVVRTRRAGYLASIGTTFTNIRDLANAKQTARRGVARSLATGSTNNNDERRGNARYNPALSSLHLFFSPCLPTTLHTPPRTMSRSRQEGR